MSRRKPDTEHRLNGTWRADRARETEPLDAALLPPSTLSPAALAVWRRREPSLREQGTLREVDRELFAAFCVVVADCEHCYAESKPLTRDLLQNLRMLSAQLGIGSESRSRLGVSPPRRRSEFSELDDDRRPSKFSDVDYPGR